MASSRGFGKRMLDPDAFAAQQHKSTSSDRGFGLRMGQKSVAEVKAEALAAAKSESDADAEAEEKTGYSTRDIAGLLDEAPARVVELFEGEMARPDGPRKGVLRLLLATERAKGDAANNTVVAAVQGALDTLTG